MDCVYCGEKIDYLNKFGTLTKVILIKALGKDTDKKVCKDCDKFLNEVFTHNRELNYELFKKNKKMFYDLYKGTDVMFNMLPADMVNKNMEESSGDNKKIKQSKNKQNYIG